MSKSISNCAWMGNANSKITMKQIFNKHRVFSLGRVQDFTHSPLYYQANPAGLTINGGNVQISVMNIGEVFASLPLKRADTLS
jgi:hypothetical protein